MVIKVHVYEGLFDDDPAETIEFSGRDRAEAEAQMLAWFEQRGDDTLYCDLEIIESEHQRLFVLGGGT